MVPADFTSLVSKQTFDNNVHKFREQFREQTLVLPPKNPLLTSLPVAQCSMVRCDKKYQYDYHHYHSCCCSYYLHYYWIAIWSKFAKCSL